MNLGGTYESEGQAHLGAVYQPPNTAEYVISALFYEANMASKHGNICTVGDNLQ